MYDNHVPLIANAMRENYEAFRRGLAFVVCSIRQPITVVPDQLATLFGNGEWDEFPLFGHKWNAWAFITDAERCRALWYTVRESYDPELVIWHVSRVPGIGIVKAGFVAQLLGCDVACLDSRNITRDGRNARAYRTDGEKRKTKPAFRRKVSRYVADTGGKARHYWDAWCKDVAPRYNMTAEEISCLHLAILPDNFVPGF